MTFQNLLRHPLCLGLVRRKWIDYGRYLYYSSLLIYLLFLAFLTSFALLTPNAKSNFTSGQRFCDATSAKKDTDESKSLLLQISQIGILIIAPLSCFFELIQFLRVRQSVSYSAQKTKCILLYIYFRLEFGTFNGKICLIGSFMSWQSCS